MNRQKISNITRKLLPQMLIQTFVILITAVGSFMFMTWFVTGVFHVTDAYTAVGYETLGTLVIFILIIVPMNTIMYRCRIREITTLSEGISSVADGNYNTRIDSKKGGQMTPIYEDFNKMCAELSSVQILRNDFINSYSHEFKTPIASINGFASLLLEKKLPDEQRREYLQIIVEESERLSKLADNTIILSKLSSQQIVTDTETYDLSEQLRQCAIILSKAWLGKKIEFSGEFPVAMYIGNKELMQHLWLNILGNAIKYTPVGGEITVQVIPQDEHVKVQISDTGEGMSVETQAHLFDPYYQGDASHSRQGLGLGLSIAKRIVDLCDGAIIVQSELGTGSIFTITLPLK
ncbi:MAG: HAMP domain-containing histidine kinase [Clostridium sp.]|nr:HAMP domain-containing histidine kinase [Clostridium sp.]MCM1172306.1 HAMP domain-containing histidine kinase [Clostridium sp.]MCM1208971.1 HAMP domain-containing histidine kinase [Ruminococcus sp.]